MLVTERQRVLLIQPNPALPTVSNRRNFYRLLQVQPDAVPEVIKAAYRALMAMHHPDKGGDHATAASITDAYATLSDAHLRGLYDLRRVQQKANTSSTRAADGAASRGREAPPMPGNSANVCCPFCTNALSAKAKTLPRCPRCEAPLTRVPVGGQPLSKERRRMLRVSKSDWAMLHATWTSDGIDVRMRDLSLSGASVYCGAALPVGRPVRIVGAVFDAVGEIVSTRQVGNVYTLHLQLITAIFAVRTGGFVSTSA